jgi:hypothetical protein
MTPAVSGHSNHTLSEETINTLLQNGLCEGSPLIAAMPANAAMILERAHHLRVSASKGGAAGDGPAMRSWVPARESTPEWTVLELRCRIALHPLSGKLPLRCNRSGARSLHAIKFSLIPGLVTMQPISGTHAACTPDTTRDGPHDKRGHRRMTPSNPTPTPPPQAPAAQPQAQSSAPTLPILPILP